MLIQGPLAVRTEESEDGTGFVLHIGFREEFQQLELPARVDAFAEYVQSLTAQAEGCPESDPNRQGMLLILQVAEQLLPMIREDALPLSEEIEIAINQKVSLTSLYNIDGNTIN